MRTAINPQTGMMETLPDGPNVITSADVERTRREVRDMLAGNVPFHDDPQMKPTSVGECDA